MSDTLLNQVVSLVNTHQPLFNKVEAPGLFGGQSGIALLYAQLYQVTNDELYAERLTQTLHRLAAQLPQVAAHSTLTYGMAGIGWLLQHLANRDLLDVDLTDVEQWIIDSLATDRHNRNAELMTGLAGKGVYFLERGTAGTDGLRQVIEAIARSTETIPGGIAWHYVSPYTDAPTYSLGLSHGVPGVISFLAKAHRQRICPNLTQPLLEASVSWLLQQRLVGAAQGSGQFPGYAGDTQPTRLAWCYGDLGVAVALWHAAGALNRPDWHLLAIELVEEAALRTLPESGVRCSNDYIDSGFCHGTAGLAHLFHRFQQATNSLRIQQAAQYWLQQTQQAAVRSDAGTASFLTYTATDYAPQPNGTIALSWQTDAGLLEGITGIALVLLTFASPTTPAWDACLMTDLSPIASPYEIGTNILV
ncbi:lanthionine synthetase C family protein [Spirosoma montaniterrae]|uniref:Lanthionine synthetase n=1 Tax=Spirosoma montaniterrae TaxID=1178516 RepID=A0A1P9WYT4_9BACT|nr:lanthionine synthetase C family protein [Spirosoma montaniterrae]AQG80546.1 hypothetical protein AWR27_15170 [Spirosoma montaniterrae]